MLDIQAWLRGNKYIKPILIVLGVVAIIILIVTISNYQISKPYRKEISRLNKQNKELLKENRDLDKERQIASDVRIELLKEIDVLKFNVEDRDIRINTLTKELKKVKGSYSKLSNDELLKELLSRFKSDTLISK